MLLDWLLALSPLLAIIVMMVRLRWSAARAGPASWLAAAVIAAWRFGTGIDILAVAQVRALYLAMDVLLIVWAAFLLYRVADEAGAIDVLGRALPALTTDRGMQALLTGWAFASFLQGVGGFGVPVVVTAPILVGMGFSPLTAVLVPSVGHAWSVTFGSLASSFQALIASTGIPGPSLAPDSAFLLGVAGVGCGALVAWIADGAAGVRRLALSIVVMGAAMGGAQYWLATNGLWNIAGFGGGLAGLGVGIVAARGHRGQAGRRRHSPSAGEMAMALAGYAVLVAITLGVQLTPAIRTALSGVVLQAALPATLTGRGFGMPAGSAGPIILLRHAGAVLGCAAIATWGIYRRVGWLKPGAEVRILAGTAQGVLPSTLGIVSMVSLATVMSQSGMTDCLAQGLAHVAGPLLPLAAPWIGALGAFITGSNTNSNVLFAPLQQRTAELIGAPVVPVLAAQTAGGAIGSVVAPTKVVVGVGSTGAEVEEGEVMRRLLGYTALLIGGVSLLVAGWLWAMGR